MTVKIDPHERFVRKGYKIWDTLKDEEFYELHYRYEVDDMCEVLNDIYYKYSVIKPFLKSIREQIIAELDKRMATVEKTIDSFERYDEAKHPYIEERRSILRLKKDLEELD